MKSTAAGAHELADCGWSILTNLNPGSAYHIGMPEAERAFRTLHALVSRQNIRWFEKQLEACTEDEKRDQLQRLLAAAKAEHRR
jgi:hypothetical protein